MITVTCDTAGCPNEGISIELNLESSTQVYCGSCGVLLHTVGA